MLKTDERYALSRMNSTAQKYDLGKALHHTLGVAVGTYSFSRDGGATGDYNLKDVNGNNLTLPSGTLICNVVLVATTGLTSGGSATIDVNANSANDCLAAGAIADLEVNEKLQGIPDLATVGDWVRLTADRTLSISVNTAALTAGALTVFFFYVTP